MLGLGRLFADDTSIGHTAHDENTLKNMINIDLKYISQHNNSPFTPYLSSFKMRPLIQTRSKALLTSALVISLLSNASKIL
jgi:hypothetical protein